MNRSRSASLLCIVCALCIAFVLARPTLAQSPRPKRKGPAAPPSAVSLPRLGDQVPDTLLKHPATKPCDVTEGPADPCATLSAGRDRVTVAWDAATRRVTYLYSTTLQTDDDIRVADVLGIDPDSPITPFPAPGIRHRFVTSDWCDTDADLSGQALWCAVMVPVRPRSGKVLAFVQSVYLYLPLWDATPIHRTSLQIERAKR